MLLSIAYTFVDGNLPWLWLCAGIILIGMEMLLPGAFLLWIGLAAVIVSIATYLLNLSFVWQALLFALSSGVMIGIGHKLWKNFSASPSPHLNRRGEMLIDRTFVLNTAIVNGQGRLKIGDGIWSIQGPNLPAGTSVRIVATAGNTLIVIQN